MKIRIFIILISINFFACKENGKNHAKTEQFESTKDTSITQTVSNKYSLLKFGGKILLSNITTHLFSSSARKDTFKLEITGDSINNALVIFSIISYAGKRIYADTFYSTELFFSEDTVLPKLQVEAGIKERVKDFFQDSAFSSPAYNPGVEANTEDPELWEEIKSDKSAIGFNYHYGEESDQCIAYSKKRHKVIIYWACC